MHFPEQWSLSKPLCTSPYGMVAAQHYLAAQAGADMLAAGGNAIDAALSCAFALNVVEPWMSGLGGSGYAVAWLAAEQKAYSINFQGALPADIDFDRYPLDPDIPTSLMGYPGVKNRRNELGYGAITVPGAVAGLALMQERFAKFGFDRLLTPAIDLAEQGLPVDWHTVLQIALQQQQLYKDPGARQIFLPAGYPPQPCSYLTLPALSHTLRSLAHHGPDDFYRGKLAEQIVADLQNGGSTISLQDMASYQALCTPANHSQYRTADLYGADDSSGFIRLAATLDYCRQHFTPAAEPDGHAFVHYAKGLNRAFLAHYQRTGRNTESGCTSHLSTVDSAGNMVALTYTLLDRFGSQVVLPSTGMVMNNAVSYFDPRPDQPSSLAPGKRINSSNMCPLIAVQDNEAVLAIGASGANYIVPAVTQLTALILDFNLDINKALQLPRIDAAGRKTVRVDPAMPANWSAVLAEHFELERAPLTVFPKLYACPSAVQRKKGLCYGMTDPSAPNAGALGL